MKQLSRSLLPAAILVGATGPASAALVNGGFEAGDLIGWTDSGNVQVVDTDFFTDYYPAEGDYFALFNFGNVTPNGTISQTFSTTPGTDYDLSFI